GVFQKNLDIAAAAKAYTTLTIGDGLVTQIPALIISTAAGIVVTRNSSSQNLGREGAGQLFLKPRAVAIVAGILAALGIVPGLPTLPFFFMAATLGFIAWAITRFNEEKATNARTAKDKEDRKPKKENIEALLPLDMVELEVGYGLINIVESDQSGDLLE